MSRGFVKEDDQEEVPLVPQRAYLPAGVPNFVTPSGMDQLLTEKQRLIDERDNLNIPVESEKRIAVNNINARLQLLNNRIADARVVNPGGQPQGEVRFGAIVTIKAEATGKIQTFRIVGVDEADISKAKIPFISPFSKALMNKKVGDKTILRQTGKDIAFEIIDIKYN